MRIKRLQLKNFKRFTDLTLQDIPESAKLVLLVGSNGSGKSSVFDAFEYVASAHKTFIGNSFELFDREGKLFYGKNKEIGASVNIETTKGLFKRAFKNYEFGPSTETVDFPTEISFKSFYGRSAFRYFPSLTKKGYNTGFDIQGDIDRPKFYSEVDSRFINDIDIIMEEVMKIVFTDFQQGPVRTDKIRDFVNRINLSFSNIFGDKPATGLRLKSILPPADGKPIQLMFDKGKSEIHYNLLSAGEKEVVNLIFNLYTRTPYFDDTIYFIDEMDSHLNTSLQYNLLKEITENWIPKNCQLWTASHSLGFIQYAKENKHAVIVDFDDLNFDVPQVLQPQIKETLDVYDIAIPKAILFDILKGKRIVVCENKNDEYYNLLQIHESIFVGVKDSRDVFLNVKRDERYHSLRDRDFLSDTEIEKIRAKYPNHHILRFYDFENYLYHPENIDELKITGFDKAAYIAEIVRQKNERLLYILPTLAASRQNYEEFKTDDKLKNKDTDSIVDDFKTDELAKFYKYFDMKDQFNKSSISAFNLTKERLVTTNWFKTQIEKILNEPN